MKLILGTANVSSLYSLNQNKKLSKINFIKILTFAYKNNIKFIDTAPRYKDAQKILGNLRNKDFNIISKISKVDSRDLRKSIFSEVKKLKKKLKNKKLYGLLIHDIDFFKKNNPRKISEVLSEIKQKKIVNKIGFSVYDPGDIDFILKFIKPDIIQLPLSLFDRRFLSTKKINKLKLFKIEVHIRSIFMRGLLLIDDDMMIKKQPKLKFILEKYKKWCTKNKITKLQAAINFVKNLKNIDGVVFGVDDINQLHNIIKAFRNKSSLFPKTIYLGIKKKHLDIRKWKI